MSYMDNKLAFAPAGAIQELSFDEVEMVEGGSLSVGTKVALRLVGRVALGAGLAGVAVGIGIEAVIWYNS